MGHFSFLFFLPYLFIHRLCQFPIIKRIGEPDEEGGGGLKKNDERTAFPSKLYRNPSDRKADNGINGAADAQMEQYLQQEGQPVAVIDFSWCGKCDAYQNRADGLFCKKPVLQYKTSVIVLVGYHTEEKIECTCNTDTLHGIFDCSFQ